MTMSGCSPSLDTSYVWITLGWFKRAAMRASSRNMVRNSGSPLSSAFSSLTTSSLSTPAGPRETVSSTRAMPPCPSVVITW